MTADFPWVFDFYGTVTSSRNYIKESKEIFVFN